MVFYGLAIEFNMAALILNLTDMRCLGFVDVDRHSDATQEEKTRMGSIGQLSMHCLVCIR